MAQALGVARVAIAKMEAGGVAWQRPPDYYAEMVKSDDHMLKVREQLAFEQKTIEEAGQRWAACPCGYQNNAAMPLGLQTQDAADVGRQVQPCVGFSNAVMT